MEIVDIEMRRRHAAVLDACAAEGAEAVLVTSPQHMVYLSGDATGYQRVAVPLGFCAQIVTPDESVLVVRRYDAGSAMREAGVGRVVEYFDEDSRPIEVLAGALQEIGLGSAALGAALGRWGFTVNDRDELVTHLPELRLLDVSRAIDACMEVKSPAELELVRAAMRLTEAGVGAFAENVREGISEAALSAAMIGAMVAAGGESPYYPPTVLAGARSALPHGGWSESVVGADEPVFIELSAAWQHYHAPLVRTAIVGRNDEAAETYAVARAANEAAVAVIGPGVSAGDVDAAVRDHVAAAGLADAFRGRSGYAMGIDWTLRGALSLRPEGKGVLHEGMTLHVPTSLIVEDRFCVGVSQSVAVTADGAERLSSLPLDLIHVPSGTESQRRPS